MISRVKLLLRLLSALLAGSVAGCLLDGGVPPQRPAGREPSGLSDIDLGPFSGPGAAAALEPPAAPPAQPSGNVMVVIESIVHSRGQRDLAALAWELRAGSLLAGSPPLAQRNGLSVAVGGRDFSAQFQAARSRYQSSEVTRQAITTLSGHEGYFFVGEQVPVARLILWTPRGSAVLFESATVGRSLIVLPTILPNGQIDLEVVPQFSSIGRGGRSIRLQELSTHVVLQHGQPLLLGALEQSSESAANVLFAAGQARRDQTLTVLVTPYLL